MEHILTLEEIKSDYNSKGDLSKALSICLVHCDYEWSEPVWFNGEVNAHSDESEWKYCFINEEGNYSILKSEEEIEELLSDGFIVDYEEIIM